VRRRARLAASSLGGERKRSRALGDDAHVLEQRDAVAHARAIAARHASRRGRAAAVRGHCARRQLHLHMARMQASAQSPPECLEVN